MFVEGLRAFRSGLAFRLLEWALVVAPLRERPALARAIKAYAASV